MRTPTVIARAKRQRTRRTTKIWSPCRRFMASKKMKWHASNPRRKVASCGMAMGTRIDRAIQQYTTFKAYSSLPAIISHRVFLRESRVHGGVPTGMHHTCCMA